MFRILETAKRLVVVATVVGALLTLGGCSGTASDEADFERVRNIFLCAFGEQVACHPTVSLSGLRVPDFLSASGTGVDGGSLGNLTPLADAACAPFGPGLTPAPDAVYSSGGSRAWLTAGESVGGAGWAGIRPVRPRHSPAARFPRRAAPAASSSSEPTRASSGSRSATARPGSSAPRPGDSASRRSCRSTPATSSRASRLLPRTRPSPEFSVRRRGHSCIPSATGIPAASVSAQAVLGFTSTGSGHVVASLVRDGVYASSDGGQSWTKASGLPVKNTPGEVTFSAPAGSGSNVYVSTNFGLYKMGASETSWSFSGPIGSRVPGRDHGGGRSGLERLRLRDGDFRHDASTRARTRAEPGARRPRRFQRA